MKVYLTYKYRVKDKHARALESMARKVNFIWNFCNDTQKHALKWNKKWPSAYELQRLTSGSSVELGLQADIIGKVCVQYQNSRRQHKRPFLRYRGKKNLGWVPVKGIRTHVDGTEIRCHGKKYSVWYSRPVPEGARICDGSSFNQDARGRWYINLVIETEANTDAGRKQIGIDLGLKSLATFSDGKIIEIPQHYRKLEKKLAAAQRAKKKKQVVKIHTKIAAQRRDHLHKVTTNIVRQYGLIAVGDVNSSNLAKTRMAKSVLDAGWSSLRHMLAYKSDYAGAIYVEVNEKLTTQACSECGCIGGPKGIAGLGIREWECVCGAVHDRDVNSAKNILRLGCQTLVEGAIA